MMPEGFWPDELSVKQVETERLRREIERLRAALAECVPFNRDACIEECARVVKAQHRLGDSVNVGLALDRAEAAIRALKDTQALEDYSGSTGFPRNE